MGFGGCHSHGSAQPEFPDLCHGSSLSLLLVLSNSAFRKAQHSQLGSLNLQYLRQSGFSHTLGCTGISVGEEPPGWGGNFGDGRPITQPGHPASSAVCDTGVTEIKTIPVGLSAVKLPLRHSPSLSRGQREASLGECDMMGSRTDCCAPTPSAAFWGLICFLLEK